MSVQSFIAAAVYKIGGNTTVTAPELQGIQVCLSLSAFSRTWRAPKPILIGFSDHGSSTVILG